MSKLRPLTEILSEEEREILSEKAFIKARSIAFTKEIFELLYAKFYLEMMQEATTQKAKENGGELW